MKLYGSENNKTILKELGQRIKDTRIKMSLTQKEFAIKAGISHKTAARLEAGINVQIESLLNVLRVFNCLDNINFLIAEQELSPEQIYKKETKRKRASSKQKKEINKNIKWGDEQ